MLPRRLQMGSRHLPATCTCVNKHAPPMHVCVYTCVLHMHTTHRHTCAHTGTQRIPGLQQSWFSMGFALVGKLISIPAPCPLCWFLSLPRTRVSKWPPRSRFRDDQGAQGVWRQVAGKCTELGVPGNQASLLGLPPLVPTLGFSPNPLFFPPAQNQNPLEMSVCGPCGVKLGQGGGREAIAPVQRGQRGRVPLWHPGASSEPCRGTWHSAGLQGSFSGSGGIVANIHCFLQTRINGRGWESKAALWGPQYRPVPEEEAWRSGHVGREEAEIGLTSRSPGPWPTATAGVVTTVTMSGSSQAGP